MLHVLYSVHVFVLVFHEVVVVSVELQLLLRECPLLFIIPLNPFKAKCTRLPKAVNEQRCDWLQCAYPLRRGRLPPVLQGLPLTHDYIALPTYGVGMYGLLTGLFLLAISAYCGLSLLARNTLNSDISSFILVLVQLVWELILPQTKSVDT